MEDYFTKSRMSMWECLLRDILCVPVVCPFIHYLIIHHPNNTWKKTHVDNSNMDDMHSLTTRGRLAFQVLDYLLCFS